MESAIGLLLSGSAGYQFFTREMYNSDLDTYCVFEACVVVGQWYLSAQYMFRPRTHQLPSFSADFERMKEAQDGIGDEDTDYNDASIVQVWDFENSTLERIQLIAARHSALEVILSFHSTCVMNFISHRAAYSLFPRTTFKHKAMLVVDNGRETPGSNEGVQKYVERGLKVIHSPSVTRILDTTSDLVAVSPRFVNDSRTWCVPIEFCGSTDPQPDFVEANSFKMEYHHETNKIIWMAITGPGC
ncbi:uncharacterized protein C8R40DRAFT_1060149 [Lentinula edodes]|uniref:uncharacterized protein n=1 Tax=Lentinula edodes TaxID=5353 RepID=UPI001E8E4C10|nr:uncharacterized protein C8R40DRAFT_1060149 [Lentinula edodes]KAH7869207.1 hypothetical protein C8R40DRAFT_1060149 [Lentinula edodes]